MSDYADKLTSITERKQKLLEEENKLIEKRKKEIGALAEKFSLLTLSDRLIVGVFSEVQTALNNQSEKIKTWENQGAKFLKPKPNRKTIEEGAK